MPPELHCQQLAPLNSSNFTVVMVLQSLRFCSYCSGDESAEEKVKTCSRCGSMLYCSLDCQKYGWDYHHW